MCGLSLVEASRGYSSWLRAGFLLRWLLLLQSIGSRVLRLHVSPVLVGKGEDAEILQAHDGPAGPGGEVGLETGLDQRVIFGLGRYQWAPPVHKAPCVLDRVGPKGVLVRYSEGWGHFSGGMLFLHVLWGGSVPFFWGSS